MTTKKQGSEAAATSKANGVSVKNKSSKEPAREPAKEKSKDKKGLIASLNELRQFLKDVQVEFSKITWPGRHQIIQETVAVLFLVTLITLMVLGFDYFLGHAIFGPLEHWARLHGGGVGR